MKRQALIRRYRYLWTGETTASLLFILLFFIYALPVTIWVDVLARAYSLLVVIIILTQGTFWWRFKLRALQAGESALPVPVLRWYRRFKWLNWLLIALFPAVLWLKVWLMNVPLHSILANTDNWAGLLIILGALLEQINYYYVQLMYDNAYDWRHLRRHRRLLPGNIGKALAVFSP